MSKYDFLFVCWDNGIRSQIAEGYARKRFDDGKICSAGLDPEAPERNYRKVSDQIIRLMKDDGVDVRGHHVKFLDESMVLKSDQVIVMCERERCPDYLLEADSIEFWDVPDPYNKDGDDLEMIRNEIRERVFLIKR